MASQVAVNHPPRGNCRFDPCPWCKRANALLPAEWIGRSPPKAALGVRISPGRRIWSRTHLVRRRRCLRREVGFDSPRDRSTRCGSSWSSSGSYKPALAPDRREAWVRFPAAARWARSTTAVQPHDKRPTRGSTPPAPTETNEPKAFGYPTFNRHRAPYPCSGVSPGRPSERSTALQAARRGFDPRPLHRPRCSSGRALAF